MDVASRVEVNGNYWLQSSSWRGVVYDHIFEARKASSSLEIVYDEITREMDISGSYNLASVTVENTIEDWQTNDSSADSPSDPNFTGRSIDKYINKHVRRNHFNGLAGEEISSEVAVKGENYELLILQLLENDYEAG